MVNCQLNNLAVLVGGFAVTRVVDIVDTIACAGCQENLEEECVRIISNQAENGVLATYPVPATVDICDKTVLSIKSVADFAFTGVLDSYRNTTATN